MTLIVMIQLIIIQNKLSELDMPEPDQQTETVQYDLCALVEIAKKLST